MCQMRLRKKDRGGLRLYAAHSAALQYLESGLYEGDTVNALILLTDLKYILQASLNSIVYE